MQTLDKPFLQTLDRLLPVHFELPNSMSFVIDRGVPIGYWLYH